MQALTKMAYLTKFRQTANFYARIASHISEFDNFGNFYANYIMNYLRGARNFDEFHKF